MRRVREHSSSNTKADLGANDARVRGCAYPATEVDKKTECDHEEACAKDNEGFEAADSEDDKSEEKTGDDGGEAVK